MFGACSHSMLQCRRRCWLHRFPRATLSGLIILRMAGVLTPLAILAIFLWAATHGWIILLVVAWIALIAYLFYVVVNFGGVPWW
jgi:hypothetical protein